MIEWTTLATTAIAVVAFTESVLTRYVRAKGRSYAAEKEFSIIRSELDRMNEVLASMEEDLRNVERNVAVIEAVNRYKQNFRQQNEPDSE